MKIGTMRLSLEEIRHRFDKAERMNCRDIADLLELIGHQAKALRAIALVVPAVNSEGWVVKSEEVLRIKRMAAEALEDGH